MTTPAPEPGSRLLDELRLLVGLVTERAGPWLDRVAATEHRVDPDNPDSEGKVSSCAWCPVCGLISVVRGEPSELAGVGLDRAADLVALLRAVLADRWEPGEPHMPGFRPQEREPEPERSTRVERIPVHRKTSTVAPS